MLPSFTNVSSRTASSMPNTQQTGCQSLTYFKKLWSETENQKTEIEKMTITVAYRNVESLGLFGYEHKVFNLKRAPPLSLTTFLPSISGLEELQSYNKFIPQVLWLKYSNKRKRRNIAVKQSVCVCWSIFNF